MSAQRLSVGLLFGGESPEHEVSIVTARAIAAHLDVTRFEVRPIGIARNGVWIVQGDVFARLAQGDCPERAAYPFLPLEAGAESTCLPDLFFNAIHGAGGEDGQIQGFLEALHRPYTGAGLLAMAVTMDKWMTKRIWESEALPVVPYIGVTEEQWHRDRHDVLASVLTLGLPLFLKPANLGSSIGIEKVKDAEDLGQAMDRAFRYDRRVLIEKGLDARELEVATLGGDDPLVSVVGEIIVAGEFYDFYDKYVNGKSTSLIPASLDPATAEEMRELAYKAYRALDCYGMARVDFFQDRRNGKIYLNEINLIPGFTPISMYPKLMEASGVTYEELLTRLVDLALERHHRQQARKRDFTSGSHWFS